MDKKLWEKAAEFHGHVCPGLAIGYKACEAVIEKMGLEGSVDEEIVCVTENDACGVDAVQAILSCTMGKGNLIYKASGKQAFSFFNRKTGESLRVCLKAKKAQDMDRQQWLEHLLSSPCEEVFVYSKPNFSLPGEARLFKTVVCEICGEGAPEHKMHVQDGKLVCADCFIDYSRGW